VKPEQIELYQHCFIRVIQAVDVMNNTRWARGEPYDRARLAADDEAMEAIIVGEGARLEISSSYLQVMVNQFFFADPYSRELGRDNWVTRVLHRSDADYFPDGWSTRRVLERLNDAR
jgi:hypothetical protein